jgi:hypothetical protein
MHRNGALRKRFHYLERISTTVRLSYAVMPRRQRAAGALK